MLATNTPRTIWDIVLPDEDATARFAADVAATLRPGDLVTLSGDLGAGKTTLARAIIRALAGDATIEVPSPTFTLLQIYDLPRFPLVHADLYRVNTLAELAELGWEEASEGAAVLVEWPDRAGALIQADRLEIALMMANNLGSGSRQIRLTGLGAWAERLARLRAARELIDSAGFGAATRVYLQGDASSRSYERLVLGMSRAILMNAPRPPDGPVPREGKSYSAIAHLAENVRPFVAIARALRDRGFSAPDIFAADIETGFLLLEDFGSEGVAGGDPPAPIEERYTAAIDVLLALHSLDLPAVLPIAPRITHELPSYDLDAFVVEIELLLDWYLPYRGIAPPPSTLREYFIGLWRAALHDIVQQDKTWVLRDFHSPNLLWLPEREGIARVGVLDFQDAVQGPAAYDVVSLLMDARVDVSEELEFTLLSRYAMGRKAVQPDFDLDEFVRSYRTLGAQRATKILGSFARLYKRDNKPQYLAHLGRVWNYLERALAHPSLAKLKIWYEANVPSPKGPSIGIEEALGGPIDPRPRGAVVLAAGLGTRMQPLTDGRPKALVEVMGRPLIDYAFERLQAADIGPVVVNVHHFADQIEAHLASRDQPKVIFSDERAELLGTGGGIAKALSRLGRAPFYLLNSDSLWLEKTSNLLRLREAFDPARMDALLLLTTPAYTVGYDGNGDYFMDVQGKLRRQLASGEKAPFIYAGAAILSPALFEGAPQGAFALTPLFDRAQEQGKLFGLALEGLFLHVGTPAAVAAAEDAIRARA